MFSTNPAVATSSIHFKSFRNQGPEEENVAKIISAHSIIARRTGQLCPVQTNSPQMEFIAFVSFFPVPCATRTLLVWQPFCNGVAIRRCLDGECKTGDVGKMSCEHWRGRKTSQQHISGDGIALFFCLSFAFLEWSWMSAVFGRLIAFDKDVRWLWEVTTWQVMLFEGRSKLFSALVW